jgi:hypothetical protein
MLFSTKRKAVLIMLICILSAGCNSCPLFDRFSGEYRVQMDPFKPFSIDASSLVFVSIYAKEADGRSDNNHYVIDTRTDTIAGTYRFTA